jgi:hypothetical protein
MWVPVPGGSLFLGQCTTPWVRWWIRTRRVGTIRDLPLVCAVALDERFGSVGRADGDSASADVARGLVVEQMSSAPL